MLSTTVCRKHLQKISENSPWPFGVEAAQEVWARNCTMSHASLCQSDSPPLTSCASSHCEKNITAEAVPQDLFQHVRMILIVHERNNTQHPGVIAPALWHAEFKKECIRSSWASSIMTLQADAPLYTIVYCIHSAEC